MASVHFSLIAMITFIACCTDAAQIVSPASESVSVNEGSSIELICVSSLDEGPIVWSYDGMPVDPQSASVDVETSQETNEDGATIVTTTLRLHQVTSSHTYTCKPRDDILNLDADEIELVVTSANKLRLVEAESSSTLEMDPSTDAELQLHCIGEQRSQPVWYYNGQQLGEFVGQTLIAVRVDTVNNVRESVLTRMHGAELMGEYQCRDANRHQADSDVLSVVLCRNK